MVYATLPSTLWSSTPVTVTVCGNVSQLDVVNVTLIGATVPSLTLVDDSPMLTLAAGAAVNAMVKVGGATRLRRGSGPGNWRDRDPSRIVVRIGHGRTSAGVSARCRLASLLVAGAVTNRIGDVAIGPPRRRFP